MDSQLLVAALAEDIRRLGEMALELVGEGNIDAQNHDLRDFIRLTTGTPAERLCSEVGGDGLLSSHCWLEKHLTAAAGKPVRQQITHLHSYTK